MPSAKDDPAGSPTKTSAAASQGATFLASVKAGDEQVVTKELAEHGTSLFDVADRNGRTCVHVAAREGHIRLVEIMTWNHYDLNTPTQSSGQTALHEAVCGGQVRMLHFLLAMGADGQQGDKDGLLPIHVAAREAHDPCISILVAVGTDINTPTVSGYTPLHYAAAKGRLDTLKLLVKLGASVMAQAKDGSLPSEFAKANKHPECMEYLENCKPADTNLPDIESREALHARVKAAEDKVDTLKEKSKVLLQSKHEEWMQHVRNIKTQQKKRTEALRQELADHLEDVKSKQATAVGELKNMVDEQQLLLGEMDAARRQCACNLPWPQAGATPVLRPEPQLTHLPSVDENVPSPTQSRGRLGSLPRQVRVDSASVTATASTTPPMEKHKKSRKSRTSAAPLDDDSGLLPPQFSSGTGGGGLAGMGRIASLDSDPTLGCSGGGTQLPILSLNGSERFGLGLSVSMSNIGCPPSPGVLRSPRVVRSNNTSAAGGGSGGSGGGPVHRVDTPAPGYSTPTLGRTSLRASDAAGSSSPQSLRSPSLSDLHEQSLRSAESMHAQKKLLDMDTIGKPSPHATRRSPLVDSGTSVIGKNTTSPQAATAAVANRGRSPGSLPHMSDQ